MITLTQRKEQLKHFQDLVEAKLQTSPYREWVESRKHAEQHPLMFMLHQPEGLPPLPEVKELQGDSHAHYLRPLHDFTEAQNYAVYQRPAGEKGLRGSTVQLWKTIFLHDHMSSNCCVETMIHELAHVLIGKDEKVTWGTPREEVVVSTVTALILEGIGIDDVQESVAYAAMYALHANGFADVLTESKTISLAHSIASALEEVLQPQRPEQTGP
jgi:hypothetical protein